MLEVGRLTPYKTAEGQTAYKIMGGGYTNFYGVGDVPLPVEDLAEGWYVVVGYNDGYAGGHHAVREGHLSQA